MSVDVMIAGAGPVGLTLASELRRYGLSVRIVDPAAQRTDKSKALVVWSRTLELLNRSGGGLAETFVAAGHRQIGANIFANAKQIGRIQLDAAPTPYPFGLMIPQSETERIMEEHLEKLGTTVERQVALQRFETTAAGITSWIGEEPVSSRWLVGCDGAHSAVRHQLGLEFHGDTLISDWYLADVYLTGPNAPTEIAIYWHAKGPLVFFPMGGGRCRVIFDTGPSAGEGGDAKSAAGTGARPDPTLSEIQAALDERGPGGIQAERPVWLASFRINERKVKSYRVGNVFLAGDAAHIHSPAGGQGMNTGMQDAMNLAWKLALVKSGAVNEELLLASYSEERSRVGDQILNVTGKATKAATLEGPVKQAIRNELAGWMLGIAKVREVAAKTLLEISIGYPHSPLNGPADGPAGGPKPGERAPIRPADGMTEPPVGAGGSPKFALCAGDEDGRSEQAKAVLAKHGTLLEAKPRPAFAEKGIWLIRPDGYVAMSAKAGDWRAVEDYLTRLVSG